jgi:hypothetical protein
MGRVRETHSWHWYSENKKIATILHGSGKRDPVEALVFRTQNQKIATIFHGSAKRDSF